MRETLFNWLQPRIDQSRVLDVFAGSGALGLEALSRGAAQVTFVEKDRRAAAAIEAIASEWQEPNARVVCESAIAWLATRAAEPSFDIVFLDPPYDAGLVETTLEMLGGGGLMLPDALVIAQHFTKRGPAPIIGRLGSFRTRRFGETTLTFYRAG